MNYVAKTPRSALREQATPSVNHNRESARNVELGNQRINRHAQRSREPLPNRPKASAMEPHHCSNAIAGLRQSGAPLVPCLRLKKVKGIIQSLFSDSLASIACFL